MVLIAKSMLLSLGLTLLLELAAAALLGIDRKWDFLLVFLVNTLTNPIVVLILNLANPWYLVVILEIGAVVTEGVLYRLRLSCKKWNPFILSLLLNSISYLGGLLIL